MKTKSIKYVITILAITVLYGCEPIVDSEQLNNTTMVDNVEMVAVQSSPGGNGITLKMLSPGVTGYWDYNIGRGYSNEVSFIYPIPGQNTFTFVGTLGAEFFEKTINVQIDVLDQQLDQDWYDLVGNNTSAGKTWIYTTTPGNGMFWYMAPPDNPEQWETAWWNAGDCCAPDANGRMTFDLNGGANFTYYPDNGAAPQNGSFSLNVPNQTLSISGAPFMGDNERGSPNDTYQIISLTETELVVYVPRTIAGDSGWTWVFKPQ